MTHNTDYTSVDIPADKPPEEYHYTERRAELLELIEQAGSPARMNQSDLAERYGVTQSQISKDLDRLGEFVGDALGQRATLSTRALHRRVITDLLETDDWRATKAAWDVQQEWNDWLADVGAQDREPEQHEHEVDVDARRTEVAYTVVREETELPTDDTGGVDYEDLGFTSAPTTIEIEDTGDGAGGTDR
jgi:predicted XRE-type DNA-binding protein